MSGNISPAGKQIGALSIILNMKIKSLKNHPDPKGYFLKQSFAILKESTLYKLDDF